MLQLSLTPVSSPAIAPVLAVSSAGSADFALALAGVTGETAAAFVPVPALSLPPDRQLPADLADLGDLGDVGDLGAVTLPVPAAFATAPQGVVAATRQIVATPNILLPEGSIQAAPSIVLPTPAATTDIGDNSRSSIIFRGQTTRSDLPFGPAEHDDPTGLADPAVLPLVIEPTPVLLPVQSVVPAVLVTEAAEPAPSGHERLVSTVVGQPAPPVPPPLPESVTPEPRRAAEAAQPSASASASAQKVTSDPAPPPILSRPSDNIAGPIVGRSDQAVRGTPSAVASSQPAPVFVSTEPKRQAQFIDSTPVSISQPAQTTAAAPAAPAPGSLPASPRAAQPPEIGIPVPALRAFAAAIAATGGRLPRTPRDDDGSAAPIPTLGQPENATRFADLSSRPLPPLDMRRDDWTRALIDRIDAVRDVANARDTRITLVPDALGKIEVALRQEGETVHVAFTADAPVTRALLADAQPRLAELAEARGLKLGETAVSAGTEGDRTASGFGQAADQRRPTPSPQGTATNRLPTSIPAPDGTDSDNRIA